MVGIVDTAVVGHLSDPTYLAAVAIGSTIFSSVFWAFGFLRMGTTGFVAQAFGRGDHQEVTFALYRALIIALLMGFLTILFRYPVGQLAFYFMGAAPEVTELGQSYFSIRVFAAPAVFINYCVLGTLIGMQRTGGALMLQLLLNGINVILDYWFVMELDYNSDGVAIASLMAEIVAAFFGLWLLRKSLFPVPSFVFFRDKVLSILALKALFEVNGNLFIRTMLLTAGIFFFTSQGAAFGTQVLAANAILLNLQIMMAYGLDGFAHSAEALVGGAYGARNRVAFIRAVRVTSTMAFLMSLCICVIYGFFGPMMIRLMTSLPEVISIAEIYLPWLIAAPIISVWSFQLDGIFIGATQTKSMRNAMIVSLAIYVAFVLLVVPLWGNHALWAAMMLLMLARAVTLYLKFPVLMVHFD